MEGIPWTSWAGNIVLLVAAVTIIRVHISSVKKDIKEILKIQVAGCDKRFEGIETVDTDQWKVINHHGHKGLDENNARVTR